MHKTITAVRVGVAALAVASGVAASSALAAKSDPLIEGAKLCTRQLPTYEKQHGIPKHLLSAIATTESGRYHQGLKISIPWPWTINAAGKGYYFNSKAEAVAAAKKLRAQGIQSMDVGCMQVNMVHHAQAFSSLEEAFEPTRNIAYAATFLRRLYEEEKSWKKAAAAYHSKTPERGSQYVGRVYNSWERLVDKLQTAKQQVPESSLSVMRAMRPSASPSFRVASNGVVDARTFPPSSIQKLKPVPDRGNTRLAAYQPPRMKTIEVSARPPRPPAPDVMVRSEIKTAAVPSAILPDTGALREAAPRLNSRHAGPNFIFAD